MWRHCLTKYISTQLSKKPNKQFKSDSPRLAFLVWVKFSVYGVPVKCRGSVAHTLIGRYVAIQFPQLKQGQYAII